MGAIQILSCCLLPRITFNLTFWQIVLSVQQMRN